ANVGNITFQADGQLKLDQPATYSGTIAGLQGGDSIDFAGTLVRGAVISGATLVVTQTNNQLLTFQLASGNPRIRWAIAPDGAGGTKISVMSEVTLPGDFNLAGVSDLLWRNTNTGSVDTWLMSNGRVNGGAGVGAVSSAWLGLGFGDFNRDDSSDI